MKRFATGLTLLSLIAISVLGFFVMHHMHNGIQCITETAARATCPEDAFAAVNFHVATWQNISLGTLEGALAGLAAILIALSLAFIALRSPDLALLGPSASRMAPVALRSRREELRWLAFHLNSPNR